MISGNKSRYYEWCNWTPNQRRVAFWFDILLPTAVLSIISAIAAPFFI